MFIKPLQIYGYFFLFQSVYSIFCFFVTFYHCVEDKIYPQDLDYSYFH